MSAARAHKIGELHSSPRTRTVTSGSSLSRAASVKPAVPPPNESIILMMFRVGTPSLTTDNVVELLIRKVFNRNNHDRYDMCLRRTGGRRVNSGDCYRGASDNLSCEHSSMTIPSSVTYRAVIIGKGIRDRDCATRSS
jgi:hypothetical protein